MATDKPAAKTTTKPTPAPEPTPAPVTRTRAADYVFVAYQTNIESELDDVRVYGRKEPAADFALEQEPAWKVLRLPKGASLAAAIKARADGNR